MTDAPDPVLEGVDALRAEGIDVAPDGDDLSHWRIGAFILTDAELLRFAESQGLADGDAA